MLDVPSAISRIEADLAAVATPERADKEKKYLKSDLVFWGATVPQIRAAVKAVLPPRVSREDALALALALWAEPVNERRMAAVEVLETARKRLLPEDLPAIERLIRESRTWAYVDALAVWAAGTIVDRHPEAAGTLDTWASDPDFWLRRASLLAILGVLRSSGQQWDRFARLADGMLEEKEFFIRKAIGWVLRDQCRRDPEAVRAWLLPRASRAAGLTVREAVKPLPPEIQAEILAAHRAAPRTRSR